MKLKFLVVTLVLFFAAVAVQAQMPQPVHDGPPFMGNWNPPAALTTDWWNNPDIANELRLTEAQKKQLEQVSTNVKLTLIDAGATGLKSYVRLQSLLDGDPFDRAAFNQELDAASDRGQQVGERFRADGGRRAHHSDGGAVAQAGSAEVRRPHARAPAS